MTKKMPGDSDTLECRSSTGDTHVISRCRTLTRLCVGILISTCWRASRTGITVVTVNARMVWINMRKENFEGWDTGWNESPYASLRRLLHRRSDPCSAEGPIPKPLCVSDRCRPSAHAHLIAFVTWSQFNVTSAYAILLIAHTA